MAQNKQINPPDLSDVLRNVKTDIFNNMNCVNIGIIQSFDASNQTATIQLALKKVMEIKEDGSRVLQERPIILECPVVILFGASTYMTFPIAEGDECLVLFNDREIDNWFNNGGVHTPSTPRSHNIADAFALVGVRSLQDSIQGYLTNGIRLAHETARLDMTQDQIDTIASEFIHTGNMTISNKLTVQGITEFQGTVQGEGGNSVNITTDFVQTAGKSISAGNGATGSFDVVTVVNGIVTGGS